MAVVTDRKRVQTRVSERSQVPSPYDGRCYCSPRPITTPAISSQVPSHCDGGCHLRALVRALGEYPRNSCRKYQAPAMADVTNFITDKADSMKSQVPSPYDGRCYWHRGHARVNHRVASTKPLRWQMLEVVVTKDLVFPGRKYQAPTMADVTKQCNPLLLWTQYPALREHLRNRKTFNGTSLFPLLCNG